MQTIAIYETNDEVGYMNRPLWNKTKHTKECLRVLFTVVHEYMLYAIDELAYEDPEEADKMLRNVMDKNPYTYYSN